MLAGEGGGEREGGMYLFISLLSPLHILIAMAISHKQSSDQQLPAAPRRGLSSGSDAALEEWKQEICAGEPETH